MGAGHGFFGNVFPMLAGADLLAADRREELLARVVETTRVGARRRGDAVHWPCTFYGEGAARVLVQWCHGAPGVVTSLGPFPVGASPELEELLLGAGRAILEAGPLTKGVGLCHGTDGNALALLELHRRTGDAAWLEQARAFAMHALGRRNRRFSLYTGDLGLAWILHACLEGRGGMPLLDLA